MATLTRLTKAGAILLAKALAGNALTFTRGALGNAAGSDVPSEQVMDNLTALISEKMSLPIIDFQTQDAQLIVTLQVSNANVTSSFRIAEGGLFAYDPETDSEVLYAYFFDGVDGDKMPAPSDGIQIEFQYEMVTAISNAQNVTCIIDKSKIEVTRADFDAHINSDAPHPNWDVVLHPEFDSHVDSANPHPNWKVKIYPGVGLSKSNQTLNVVPATTTRLGGIKVGKNLYMEDESLNAVGGELDVESRIKQLEINQANLYILLEAANKFGVQGNLIMTEDFKTLKYTNDNFVNATIAAEGKDFTTDGIGFLRSSSFAVITNGLLFNKAITVDSIQADDGDFILTANSKLNETTKRGKVYRSSVTIRDNKAFGAGLVKVKTQSRGVLWKGEGSSSIEQITFNAYPSLESSLGLDGDWSLTSDGYFTLD